MKERYFIQQQSIETILGWIRSNEIAIPEIQRPFVWDATKVRDLIDSLYNGFPIGYIIVWKNPNITLKDGKISEGKKILIDGQQRITALTASILGNSIINEDYQSVHIKIAFNPILNKFEVCNPAIQKDVTWIDNIAPIINGEKRGSVAINEYCEKNPSIDRTIVEDKIEYLKEITKKDIGIIELAGDLDIQTVTDIFIRINSKGVVLSQADFVMSKIASDIKYGGETLRKCIDYFCHLAVSPDFYKKIQENDKAFIQTDFFNKIAWLKEEQDDIYDPNYSDMLRVAFTSEFARGKLADLVSLLSGRDFESRSFKEEIMEESFKKLKNGILNFINEQNFKRFIMILKSAGFIDDKLIGSQNALNFAYILYLSLRNQKYSPSDIEHYVKRWFVLSLLTGRYSGSPESMFDYDIRQLNSQHFNTYLDLTEKIELSDAFWDFALIQDLDSFTKNTAFNVYLSAQVFLYAKGFLSSAISIRDMIEGKGDIHHIFPKEYLKSKHLSKKEYNQVANYVYTQTEINIKIGKKAPKVYLQEILENKTDYCWLSNKESIINNFKNNDIPLQILESDFDDYDLFLIERRKLMAQKIKQYYFSL